MPPFRSRSGALRIVVAWRTCVSTSWRYSASASTFAHSSLASGISLRASSRADWPAEIIARFKLSTEYRRSSNSPVFSPEISAFASRTAMDSVRSAASAIFVSSTSCTRSGGSSSPIERASSKASCRRKKRPSTESSKMSSASRRATRSSSSARTSVQRSGFRSSMYLDAFPTRSSGAPARRALTRATFTSARPELSDFTSALRSFTVRV
mmetsp:Transcript_81917/g.211076  ORF Transcript_81917/g.211076 Transcript_81917/m.211076 type:complete len:210 (+) Transcript_81917:1711-2340(+)